MPLVLPLGVMKPPLKTLLQELIKRSLLFLEFSLEIRSTL
jgi:hypothetical protein